jgi:hypothetical protein
MAKLQTLTLLGLIGFYGAFITFGIGHLFDVYQITGAFDVDASGAESAVASWIAQGNQSAAAAFGFIMPTRIEGGLWLSGSIQAIYALTQAPGKARAGTFLFFFLSCAIAGTIHAHHLGLLPGFAAPSYVFTHDLNSVLLVADSMFAGLSFLCFQQCRGADDKAKKN